ncbi:MAG: hypothetical protein WC333_01065 [Dehalococcoidia bacterium]|jgi:hypothetical protein
MNNISIIIPVHEYNDKVSEYLTKSFDSVVAQEGIDELPQVLIVFPAMIETEMVSFSESMLRKHQEKGKSVLIKNEGNSDYQSQVNLAVESVNTPYFSVLEFDDEYGKAFVKNAEKYIASYSDVDVFLTMMIEVNDRNEGVKITNETVWAQQFVGENGEMGYLNLNALKQYTDFKLSGAVIKKSEFKNLGGYKSNIKLTFMYEFLLRALNNACKIFSMPKIGYKHLFNREGSLFDVYSKTMPVNERKFWFETATKESNFPTDRAIDMSLLKK